MIAVHKGKAPSLVGHLPRPALRDERLRLVSKGILRKKPDHLSTPPRGGSGRRGTGWTRPPSGRRRSRRTGGRNR